MQRRHRTHVGSDSEESQPDSFKTDSEIEQYEEVKQPQPKSNGRRRQSKEIVTSRPGVVILFYSKLNSLMERTLTTL